MVAASLYALIAVQTKLESKVKRKKNKQTWTKEKKEAEMLKQKIKVLEETFTVIHIDDIYSAPGQREGGTPKMRG